MANPTVWFKIADNFFLPDDAPFLVRWTADAFRDVKLTILPGGSDPPQAAVLYVGKLLVMERGIDIGTDHVPIKFGRHANVATGMSETGNFLGRVMLGEYRESKAEFKHITPTFYRQQIDPFIAASKITPFFWVWNPSEYAAEVGYAWMINEPQPATSPVTRRVAIDFEMRGVA